MEPVIVQSTRARDPRTGGVAGYHIGEDEHGLWVGLPRGSRRWKGETLQGPTAEAAVQCFPHEGWWVLHYVGAARPISHFVDITTQPIMADGRIEMIDLDLDLLVHDDGTVRIRARQETEELAARLRRCQEPFFEVADEWPKLVLSSPFPDPAPG